eukprot:scaffold4331_cov400-Prasinococcus_capsulatus_cf.AAC.10
MRGTSHQRAPLRHESHLLPEPRERSNLRWLLVCHFDEGPVAPDGGHPQPQAGHTRHAHELHLSAPQRPHPRERATTMREVSSSAPLEAPGLSQARAHLARVRQLRTLLGAVEGDEEESGAARGVPLAQLAQLGDLDAPPGRSAAGGGRPRCSCFRL